MPGRNDAFLWHVNALIALMWPAHAGRVPIGNKGLLPRGRKRRLCPWFAPITPIGLAFGPTHIGGEGRICK
jgi:hypothetical protein